MAKKPIVEIPIDDSKFRAFKELFDKYNAELDKMPEKWKDAQAVMNTGLAAVVEQTHALHHDLRKAVNAQHQFSRATHQGVTGLKKMGKEVKDIAHHLFSIGKFFLKTGGWGAGLIGAGLFGVDRLANSAVQTQKSARSLGISYGQAKAFNQDFSRYGITTSNVQAVANEQNTPAGQVYLAMQTGLRQSVVEAMNPARLTVLVAQAARRIALTSPKSLLGINLDWRGFGQSGIDVSEARLLGRTGAGNLNRAQTQWERDSATFEVHKRSVNALYSFSNELLRAGHTIETVLTRKLSTLGGPLTSFISSLTGDAEILLNGIFSKANLQAMQDGLTSISKYLASGQMTSTLKSFAADLGEVGAGLHTVARWMRDAGWIAHKVDKPLHALGTKIGGAVFDMTHAKTQSAFGVTADQHSVAAKAWNWFNRPNTHGGGIHYGAKDYPGGMSHWWHGGFGSSINYGAARKMTARYGGYILAAAAKYGVSPDLLTAVIENESHGDPNAKSSAGAIGLMQLMPSTAKGLGVNPYNIKQNVFGGALHLARRLADARRYLPKASEQHQIALALAMYNTGQGNIGKDVHAAVAKYGKTWESHLGEFLPAETRHYVPDIMATMRQNRAINFHVTLKNNAGGSVAASLNAAPN